MSAGVIANREREYKKPLPEFKGEKLNEGAEEAASRERTRSVETEAKNGNHGRGASQDVKPSSGYELDLMVNELIDRLGPLSDEEAKKIREWLELGS